MKKYFLGLLIAFGSIHIGFSQKIEAAEGYNEGSDMNHDNIIGLYQGVILTYMTDQGETYIRGFEKESLSPEAFEKFRFVTLDEQPIQVLDFVMTLEGPVVIGYRIDKELMKTLFYAQRLERSGHVMDGENILLSVDFDPSASQEDIQIKISENGERAVLLYKRNLEKKKVIIADIVMFNLDLKVISQVNLAKPITISKSENATYNFNVFIGNAHGFVTSYEEVVTKKGKQVRHVNTLRSYDEKGQEMGFTDFGSIKEDIYNPYISFLEGSDEFKITALNMGNDTKEENFEYYDGVFTAKVHWNSMEFENKRVFQFRAFQQRAETLKTKKFGKNYQVIDVKETEDDGFVFFTQEVTKSLDEKAKTAKFTYGEMVLWTTHRGGEEKWMLELPNSKKVLQGNYYGNEIPYFTEKMNPWRLNIYANPESIEMFSRLGKEELIDLNTNEPNFLFSTYSIDLLEGVLKPSELDEIGIENPYVLGLYYYSKFNTQR